MENYSFHNLNNLFAQLGLPNDDASIKEFIASHRITAHDMDLHQAPWWTPGQAEFLKTAIDEDADWAMIVDELSELLRD